MGWVLEHRHTGALAGVKCTSAWVDECIGACVGCVRARVCSFQVGRTQSRCRRAVCFSFACSALPRWHPQRCTNINWCTWCGLSFWSTGIRVHLQEWSVRVHAWVSVSVRACVCMQFLGWTNPELLPSRCFFLFRFRLRAGLPRLCGRREFKISQVDMNLYCELIMAIS